MPPVVQSEEKRRYVRGIFSEIAPRYDFLNSVLSANIDASWRRAAVDALNWQRAPGGTYLDACAGTLALASVLAGQRGFSGRVVATDFALPMLRGGTARVAGRPIRPGVADTIRLPLRDASLDGAMVGFGVRNLTSVEQGVAELYRVLKPGARLVILDFTTPQRQPMRGLYLFYIRRVLPVIGRAVSGHPTAYSYLPESVLEFASPTAIEGSLVGAGFRSAGHRLLTGGIVAVTWGDK